MPLPMPRCAACRFYMAENKLCRRYPPQVLAWKNEAEAGTDKEIVLRSQFPIMEPTGSCGEWQGQLQ